MIFRFHTKEKEWATTLFFPQRCMLSTQFNPFVNSTQGSFSKAYIHPTKFCLPLEVKGMIETATQMETRLHTGKRKSKNFVKIKAEFKFIKK